MVDSSKMMPVSLISRFPSPWPSDPRSLRAGPGLKHRTRTLPGVRIAGIACLAMLLLVPGGELFAMIRSGDKGPVIVANPEVVDFGEVLAGEEPLRTVTIRNSGDADLILLKVGFTCGCTIPRILFPGDRAVLPDRKGEKAIGTLAPGEEALLELRFHSSGHKGKQRRKLTLHSNDPNRRAFVLPVTAQVRPAFTLEPLRFDFGTVKHHHTARRCMTLRATRPDPFRIAEIRGLPPYLKGEWKPVKEGDLPGVVLTLELEETAPVGFLNAKMILRLEGATERELTLYISGRILPPITVDTGSSSGKPVLDFGVVSRTGIHRRFIEITNTHPAVPYKLTGHELGSRNRDLFEIETEAVIPGTRYRVRVTVKPDAKTRFFRGVLKLRSDHPDMKEVAVTLQGWIAEE